MSTKMGRGSVALLVAIVVSAVAVLSAHGRDDLTRDLGDRHCEDGSPAPGTVSAWQCIVGQYCTWCNNPFGNPIGTYVGPTGGDNMNRPVAKDCGGDRFIGICVSATGNGRIDCDLSMATLDGKCSGSLDIYQLQPIGP